MSQFLLLSPLRRRPELSDYPIYQPSSETHTAKQQMLTISKLQQRLRLLVISAVDALS